MDTAVSTAPDSAAYLWQVMLGLFLVLGIIFAIAWFLRRFGQGGFLAGSQMKVVASLPLSTRERVVMIEVGGQQILLGVAPGRVNKLHVFSEPVIDGTSEKQLSEFGLRLREVINRGDVK